MIANIKFLTSNTKSYKKKYFSMSFCMIKMAFLYLKMNKVVKNESNDNIL